MFIKHLLIYIYIYSIYWNVHSSTWWKIKNQSVVHPVVTSFHWFSEVLVLRLFSKSTSTPRSPTNPTVLLAFADDRGWPGKGAPIDGMTHKKNPWSNHKNLSPFRVWGVASTWFDLSPKLGACKVSHFADLYHSYHLGGSWATSPYGQGCNRYPTIMLEQL